MIALEDIITCKSYHDLCDFRYDAPNLDDIPPTGVVQVPLDQIENFFQRNVFEKQSFKEKFWELFFQIYF